MNMFKSNGGFTLVELIVVIAILAILAGIAVPAYTGYIDKAKEASDYSLLDSIKTAAIFEATEEDEGNDCVVKSIIVTEKSTTVTVNGDDLTITGGTVDISEYVKEADIDFQSKATKAIWAAADGTVDGTAVEAGWNLIKPTT